MEGALAKLELPNVTVSSQRAEELTKSAPIDILTARALAPLPKALDLFGPALKKGMRALLYKGPDTQQEIADAERELKKFRLRAEVAVTYDLPDSLGTRTIIRLDLP